MATRVSLLSSRVGTKLFQEAAVCQGSHRPCFHGTKPLLIGASAVGPLVQQWELDPFPSGLVPFSLNTYY